MVKRSTKSKRNVKSAPAVKKGTDSRKIMWISVISVVVLVGGIVAWLALAGFQDTTIAGRAFHATDTTALDDDAAVDVQLNFDRGFAGPGDTLDLELSVHSDNPVWGVGLQIEFAGCLEQNGDPVRANADVDDVCTATVTFTKVVNVGGDETVNFLANDEVRSATVTVAPTCVDNDNDGFGDPTASTHPDHDNVLKACWYPDTSDCNDACNGCHPAYQGDFASPEAPRERVSAGTELCDGLDNNCDGAKNPDGSANPDAGAVGSRNDGPLNENRIPLNSRQQGVCFQSVKTCTNGAWVETYPDTYQEQELCDFLDHDCNGDVRTATDDDGNTVTDLTATCTIGGVAGGGVIGTLGSLIPGNIAFEYEPAAPGASHADPQRLAFFDELIHNLMTDRLNNPDADCGVAEATAPCEASLTDTINIFYCLNNVYYTQAKAGGDIARFSAEDELELVEVVPALC